jgi:hypothetical protein
MNHLDYIEQPDWDKQTEYMKSKVRSKVEHPFYIIKRLFGYRKAVYRGLAKNHARLYMLFCSGLPAAPVMVAGGGQSFGACLTGAVRPNARKGGGGGQKGAGNAALYSRLG